MTDKALKGMYRNRKVPQGTKFDGQNLAYADFRGSSVVRCSFVETDLSYASFEGANCYEADFTRANLYRVSFKDAVLANALLDPKDLFGATFTMTCDSFDNLRLGGRWKDLWLYIALQMTVDQKTRETLVTLVGEEKLKWFERLFRDRVF